MKNKKWIIIGAIVLVVVLLVTFYITTYNSMVKSKVNIDKQFANIQVQLQRRADLIPNFAKTVKGAADFEKTTYTDVTKARSAVSSATNASELSTASDELNKAISVYVNAVTEAYPQLTATENFRNLQDELSGTENRIAVARKDFNEAVNAYNTQIATIPNNIVAGMNGFKAVESFAADASAQTAPEIDFGS